MSSRLRHVCIALAIVALALLSHARLFRAGWLGGDLYVLWHAQSVVAKTDSADNARAGWLDFGRIRPVPGIVLVAHERLFGAGGAFAPGPPPLVSLPDAKLSSEVGAFAPIHARSLRIVSLVVLLAGAAAAGFALRRSLLPWIGRDTARAAGFAMALFFATHPLGTAAVARPGALGDLFAIFFSGLAAYLFLRGRQEREKRHVVLAGVCALLAGFSSPVALLLPFVLAGLELGSARRPRPFFARVRTAATTFVVFLGCVLLETPAAALAGVPHAPLATLAVPAWSDAPRAVEACVEKLGVLFLPVPGQSTGGPSQWPSYLLSVALVLIASLPVFRSARSAPRLWGWLGIAWMLAMALALVPHAVVRVEPGDYSHAEILAAATLFACAGLAVASTALLGTRRILLPAAIAIGFAWLGAQGARGFDHAAKAVEVLRADILRARALGALHPPGGEGAHVLVIDPPARAGGLDLGLSSLRLLADDPGTREPRAIVREALGILARTTELDTWRDEGLVLVTPAGMLGGPTGPDLPRALRVVPPAFGALPPILWPRGAIRREPDDVDAGAIHCARVLALPDASTAEAPHLGWRVSEPAGERYRTIGVWMQGEGAPVAVFDLAASHEWWMAPSVRTESTESPFTKVAQGELLADIPLAIAGGAPLIRGNDWTFTIDRATLPAPVRGQIEYVLELVDLARLEFARIDVVEGGSGTTLELTARGAAGFERAVNERGGGPVVWSLDRRVGRVTVARASGRRD